jgi:hypothetical protein
MNDQFQADNNAGKATLPGTVPEEQTNHDASASQHNTGDTGGGDEIMIPKHRFDEVNTKLKTLQEQLDKQGASSQEAQDVQKKLAQVFAPQSNVQDPELKSLIEDYKLPPEFVDKLSGVVEKKLKSSFDEKLRPLQSSTAEMHFRSELAELKSKYPAINDWDNAKMTELRKVYAGEERYRGLSLDEIVRLRYPEATQKTGSSYAAESSHGRTAQTQGEKPVAEMTDAEFDKHLISLGAQKAVRK